MHIRKLRNTTKKGFTLVETALVLTISAIIGFVTFSQLVKTQEVNKAQYAGEQIRMIGESVNTYISNHYDSLSTLSNATGSSLDVGPRTCAAATNNCTITLSTLVNEGLLPASYSGKNVYGQGYTILLKRAGASPYYKITGMVLTDASLGIGSNIRYDLLGQAMQKAGIDSGMTNNSSSVVSGFNGSWTANNSDFSNINKIGLLAYQTGYGSYNYSIFLRRDGTLPMTGDLNMGGNDINNVVDYNGSGNITTGGKVIAGSEISAKNGYGDTITIGGDSVSNDYEIRLGTGKPLTIYSPNAAANSTVFFVGGNTATSGRLSTNGLDPNDLPTGWAGGLRSTDILASATIAVAPLNRTGASLSSTTDTAAYMDRFGNIYGSNSLSSGGNITAKGLIATNGLDPKDLPAGWTGGIRTYDVYASSLIGAGTNKQYAAYMSSNGGIYASGDVKVDKTIYAGGNIQSGSQIIANGRLTTNEFLQINGIAGLNGTCSPNGVFGRDSAGSPLNCINGKWSKAAYNISSYSVTFSAASSGAGDQYQRTNMGSHLLCYISGIQTADGLTKHNTVYLSNGSWILEQRVTMWPAGINTWAQGICLD